MGGDGVGRLRCESVRFVRDGARVFGNLVYVPCVRHASAVFGMVDTCSCACLAIHLFASASVA